VFQGKGEKVTFTAARETKERHCGRGPAKSNNGRNHKLNIKEKLSKKAYVNEKKSQMEGMRALTSHNCGKATESANLGRGGTEKNGKLRGGDRKLKKSTTYVTLQKSIDRLEGVKKFTSKVRERQREPTLDSSEPSAPVLPRPHSKKTT